MFSFNALVSSELSSFVGQFSCPGWAVTAMRESGCRGTIFASFIGWDSNHAVVAPTLSMTASMRPAARSLKTASGSW